MPMQNLPAESHANLYASHTACSRCKGIVPHENWCENWRYAHEAVLYATQMTITDHLHLHALGVAWVGDAVWPAAV